MKINTKFLLVKYILSIFLKNSIRNSGLNQCLGTLSLFSFSEFEQNDLTFISRYKIKVPYNALDAYEIPKILKEGRKRNTPKEVSRVNLHVYNQSKFLMYVKRGFEGLSLTYLHWFCWIF